MQISQPAASAGSADLSEYDAKDGDGPFGSYFDYSQIGIAKAHAIRENRPLLLVASMNPCTHCDNFSRRILRTPEFRSFAIENRIVVCDTRNNNLLLYTHQAYRVGYDAYFSGAPHVYLFKVTSNTVTNWNAFKPDQAEPLKSQSTGKHFVGSYKANTDFMGIPTGDELKWSPSTFIRQVRACFPNQHFTN